MKSKKIDSKQFRKPKRKQNPEILENHPKKQNSENLAKTFRKPKKTQNLEKLEKSDSRKFIKSNKQNPKKS